MTNTTPEGSHGPFTMAIRRRHLRCAKMSAAAGYRHGKNSFEIRDAIYQALQG